MPYKKCNFRECYKTEKDDVLSFLRENIIYSGYILANVENYDLHSKHFALYISKDDIGKICCVVAKYYNSIQCVCFKFENDLLISIIDFIEREKIFRITGNVEFLEKISAFLPFFKFTKGKIFKMNCLPIDTPYDHFCINEAKSDDAFLKIAKLICSDQDFKRNYAVSSLFEQLKNRFENNSGYTFYCEIDDEIVATASIYALSEISGVISGVVTMDGFKRKGLGTALLCHIKKHLLIKNKIPLIYFFEEKLEPFYSRIGVEEIAICAKLERKNE